MSTEYVGLDDAYRGSLRELHDHGSLVSSVVDPTSIGSAFGSKARPFRELLNYSFVLSDPTQRIVTHPSRRMDVPFAVASALWTLAGSDSLAFIEAYNPRGTAFSDDGYTLHGAHGKRLFASDGVNQVSAAIERLRRDSHSRRAATVVLNGKDAISSARDIPCVISIHFLLRQAQLHCIVNMRSQSAAMVLPYDVFAFSFLQECMAVELGVTPGRYFHNSGSFHYYSDEESLVQQLLVSPKPAALAFSQFPAMPATPGPFAAIADVLDYETAVRTALTSGHSAERVLVPQLPPYWRDVALIMAVGLTRRTGGDTSPLVHQLSRHWASMLTAPREAEGLE
jgi:thymidylate synthase